jgi:hypothetical protein
MKGQIPKDTSTSTHPYVAFRLLKMRFVDIISSLDNDTWMKKGKGKAVEPEMEYSGLKTIVS